MLVLSLLTVHSLITGSALAQNATDTLAPMRTKAQLDPSDLQALGQYFDAAIEALHSRITDPKAARRYLNTIAADYNHADNQPAFRNAYVEQLVQKTVEQLSSADVPLATTLLMAVKQMQDIRTLVVYQSGLSSSIDAVRLLSFSGLESIRTPLDNSTNELTAVLSLLEKQLAQEKSTIILNRAYQLLSFNAQKELQIRILVAGLKRRLDSYAQTGSIAEQIDLTLYNRLLNFRASIGAADRGPLINLLAAVLVHYTHRYIYSDLSQSARDNLVVAITQAEKLLAELTEIKPESGGLTSACQSAGAERQQNIKNALFKWVGSAAAPGVLNGNPWQVPVNAGLTLKFDEQAQEHHNEETGESPTSEEPNKS